MPRQILCRLCKKPFLSSYGGKYCSFECRNISWKQMHATGLKKWKAKHPEKHMGQSSYLRLRFGILSRDNFTCQYCGRKAPDVILHIDHIRPLSKGGSSNKDNLITACQECNYGKSDVLLKAHRLKNEQERREKT